MNYNMKKLGNRIIAMILAFAMTVTLIPGGTLQASAATEVIAEDNEKPGIYVAYKETAEAANENYYSASRTAIIRIKEADFYPEDVVVTVEKRLNNETTYSPTIYTNENGLSFVPYIGADNNAVKDTYAAELSFTEEADYILDISYTDKSGNQGESYHEEFTIDKTDPSISVEFRDEENTASKNGYYNAERTAIITVNEHNFRAGDFDFVISATDVSGNEVDLSENHYSEYLKNPDNWTESDEHTAKITLTADGNYTFSMNYSDLAGREAVEKKGSFCLDKQMPENLKVTYSQSIFDVIAEKIGFYKDSVTVTIEAVDKTSGIDYFKYSYAVQESASSVNTGAEDIVVSSAGITYEKVEGIPTGKAKTSFRIEPQFRGSISFEAYDRAGNMASHAADKIVVVDHKAPEVEITYDNYSDNEKHDNYYKANRTATIKIKEANFYAEDVVVKVEKRLDNETAYTPTTYTGQTKLEFVPYVSEGNHIEDTYTASVAFEENADYKFSVTYTDRSGNAYQGYEEAFTIDKILPIVEMTYDNHSCRNSDQFKANRTATIKITEHNFDASDIVFNITARNKSEQNVEITDYEDFLRDRTNWSSQGDVHTIQITFDAEANYVIEKLEYADMAGNVNNGVDYEESAAPTRFTIDKTIPTANIQIGTWTQSADGNRWDHFINSGSFGLWDNKTAKVTVNNDDELSGIDIIEHFRSSELLPLDEVTQYEEWISVDRNSRTFFYEVALDESFVVYVHVVDRAGNELYLSSDGVTLDATLPSVEKVAPEITATPTVQPVNGIYNTDVMMDVKVVDPAVGGVYSGLKSIKYEVYNNSTDDTKPTQSGTLFTFDKASPQKNEFVQMYEKNAGIIVDCKLNNSNDVVVKIIVTDNAGNITTKTCDLKIDITAPTIDISYSDNEADSETFFKADRVAEIVITERNFNANDVKINITNTDGSIPKVSEWQKSGGSGNLDDTKWIAKIVYDVDGDYTFDIEYTDLAGNRCPGEKYAAGTVAAKAFTIDKTIPEINVVYDNDQALNNNYYNDTRIATVTITEHNFSEDRVKLMMTAEDDGAETSLPTVSPWSSNGDKNVATIVYDKDAFYTFDIEFVDKAGNEAEDFEADEFYVDKTMPMLEITGVDNDSANNGEVNPVVIYSDTNYDPEQVSIRLTGADNGEIELKGAYTEIHNGQTFTFENFAEEKEMDDIYTLTAQLTDKAGNTSKETILFSVNRFGSNYELSKATKQIDGTYVKEPIDIEISEINANKLENIKITVFRNNETIALEEGHDYRIDLIGGNGQWYQYTYTIFASNFAEDAVYRVTVYSEDEAGNISENTLDTKNSEIQFGVDGTAPLLMITNAESNVTYAVDNLQVIMTASDNLLLNSVEVYLDDYNHPYKTWNSEEIAEVLAANETFNFDILGDSATAHKLKVVCTDEAGNTIEQEVIDFYVTTNLWVRFYTNKPLFYGTIGCTVVAVAVLGRLVAGKKNKKEEAEAH